MHTIRRFINYYAPYKAVFFIDLICAAAISIIDLAYPQILRTMTATLFTRDSRVILSALPFIAAGLFAMYVIQSPGAHDGRQYGAGHAPAAFRPL